MTDHEGGAEDKRAIGDRIKGVRLARGFKKQKDVYLPLGITASGYSEYERGGRRPPSTALAKIADFLQCPVEFLLIGDETRLDQGLRIALMLDPAPAKPPSDDRKAEIKTLVDFVQSEAQRNGDEISANEVIERVIAHMLDRS